MEYLYLNNEIILCQIKKKMVEDKLPEYCAKFESYIDYSKVYFFVNLDPNKLGFIYAMALVKKKIDNSITFQVYAGVKVNMINSIFDLLDLLTKNNNYGNENFIVYESYPGFRVWDTFFFNPGDIINKISKKVEIHSKDRIFSSYSSKFLYDLMHFTIDSYQNGQLFRKTFLLFYQDGELYLLESYPSIFQYAWNCFKNVLTQKKVKNDKKGNPHTKLNNE